MVDEWGEGVAEAALGDRVAALSVRGSYAEYLCLPAEDLVPVPKGVDPVEAACLAFIHLTAYQMMHRAARDGAGSVGSLRSRRTSFGAT